ncbi:uncharacterized protein LOC131856494 [Cryptomeria japonica]|uniref:uncharacterized protein LOC131856494 n=1 Tax=Cryptomeria japonica TaxID=3369 RepID=UPI0027DA4B08|nr:uncharacterized protein LOC131856494 [Cryptomeria japonica]
MSIQMTPFVALYGYEAPSFLVLLLSNSRVPSAGDLLQESRDIMKVLKENIVKAQNQQKQYANHKRTKRSFKVGDMVIIRQVGEVSYELELLADSRVHNVFHVSRLKKALAHRFVPYAVLPPLDNEGKLILIPKSILDVRERQLRRWVIREYLIKWKYLLVEHATWKSEEFL